MIIEYTPDLLRKIQIIQLEMLLEIDRICKKYNINYTICAGTLLGAVRHKGFIPWDDDIDIDMLRTDYEYFLDIAQVEMSKDYFIQNYKTDKDCLNISFTKIRKNGTIHESIGQSHLNRHKGISVDIFPIDYVPEDAIKRKIHKETITFLQKIVAIKLKYNYYNEKFMKRMVKIIGSIILTPIPIVNIGRTMEYIMRFYEKKGSSLVANTFSKSIYDKLTFNKCLYESIIPLEFEGYLFPAPKNWEFYLTQYFGDYLILPPEEKRWNYQHKVVKVFFGVNDELNEE